jgi:hypothetical protein
MVFGQEEEEEEERAFSKCQGEARLCFQLMLTRL